MYCVFVVTVWVGQELIFLLIWSSLEYEKVCKVVCVSCACWCVSMRESKLYKMLFICSTFPGAKELNLGATVEHLRDHRPGMVRTKVSPLPHSQCTAPMVHTYGILTLFMCCLVQYGTAQMLELSYHHVLR